MSRWFRFYDEALNDPKVQRLSPELFKVWVNFLCLASKGDGMVMRKDVTFGLRFTEDKDAEFFLGKLIEFDLIEDRGDALVPHNWRKRQYKSDVSTSRVKQFRKRQRNVSETPPETEQNRDRSEQKEDTSLRSVVISRETSLDDDWPKDFRERFWAEYPKKVGKSGALRKLERVRSSVSWARLIAAVRAYAATADPAFTKHPETWLSKGCWDDEPIKPGNAYYGTAKGNVIAAADRLQARIADFDRDLPICSGENTAHVRLLSKG